MPDLHHSLKVRTAKRKTDGSRQQAAKTRSMPGDPCDSFNNSMLMMAVYSIANCSNSTGFDLFDPVTRTDMCNCAGGMLEMVNSLPEAEVQSLMACPWVNSTLNMVNLTCTSDPLIACLDELDNYTSSDSAGLDIVCNDCLRMLYEELVPEGMPLSNEDQVLSNMVALCNECTMTEIYDAFQGNSMDYSMRVSQLCSSCGMKVMQGLVFIDPADTMLSMVANIGCYKDQSTYCAERLINGEFGPAWDNVVQACNLPADPMNVSSYNFMDYLGKECSAECKVAMDIFQAYMGCCLVALEHILPWESEMVWSNMSSTCFGTNPMPTDSCYSPIPVSFRISIENLIPTQWYFSYYGMTYDIADEFMKSAVIDFVTSFPATFNGTQLSPYVGDQYPFTHFFMYVEALSAEHEMMLRTELSQYLDNKFTILQGLFRGWTEQYWELKYNFSDPMLIYFFSNWNNYCYAGSSWKNITRDPSKSLITGGLGRKMELGKKEVWLCMRGDTCGTWSGSPFCYVYDEQWSVFVPWDYQTNLGIM